MKRLLVVVDYQNDFVDGALGFPGAEKLEKPIADKIAAYREAGDEVAFTFDTHRRNYLDTQEGKNLPVAHCVEGTPGHDLYGQVADCLRDSDTVFCKPACGSAATPSWRRPPAPRCPSSWTPPARPRSTPTCTRKPSTSWRACRYR